MTRPGGPAAPLGPSIGMEIAVQWAASQEEVRGLARRIDAALAAAREEKDKAWLEEIASHGGWASDVIYTRCMDHREHRELNLNAAGPSECGWCAYLRGRDG